MNWYNIVVRITLPENKQLIRGAIYWYDLLKPKGVPLANILFSDTDNYHFPFLILERLEGKDLGLIYSEISATNKKLLAQEIIKIQSAVANLPLAKGFGFVESYKSNLFDKSWTQVLQKSLGRSRERIKAVGAMETEVVTKVEKKLSKYEDYFLKIKPIGFLDDITTKNVIVNNGKLSGIIDVDAVCFGDNLLTIALTRASLLNSGDNLDYIEFWCDEMKLTVKQRKVVDVYTALFCVDFLSEVGQQFNKNALVEIDAAKINRLENILAKLLNSI